MQPGYSSQAHPADKPVGIVLMILNALGACGSLLLVVGGGAIGALGGAAAVKGEAGGAVAAGAAGGIVMVLGIVLLIVSAISIYGAFGIMQSRKQGFMIVLILGVIGLLMNIVSIVNGNGNFFGIGLGILAPIYAFLRLNGSLPPKVEQ